MTKVYQLRRRYAAYFETKYCGVVVQLVFSSSVGNAGELKAELTTSDRFIQDAIEHDPRYGREFYLVEQYGEPDAEPEVEEESVGEESTGTPKKKTKKAKAQNASAVKMKSVNDAIYYMENTLGVDIDDDSDIDALLAKYNIVIE